MRTRWGVVAGVIALVAAGVMSVPSTVGAAPLSRPADPVVLTGADLPTFSNGPRGNIVGFRWSGATWQALPIQIDERAVVNFGKIYNDAGATFYGSQVGLVNQLVYTSTATWTGKDPNGKFDNDDELVFMARDAGVEAPPASRPVGTVAGSGAQIRITDPTAPGAEGYVYLFRKAAGSGLKQSAGVKYVKYAFKLLSGKYKTSYQLTGGPNTENTKVTGATYTRHFTDRWLHDGLSITAPGASKADILDRQKVQFAPNVCSRSEDTFRMPTAYGSAEGAFVINKSGPVRAIRSFVGANSGPSTQRTHVFYDRREDIVTDLRVHPIPSVMDFMDYSPAAAGMTYRNALNPSGVPLDGAPDSLTGGTPTWEQVEGPQGTLTTVSSFTATGFTPTVSPYYLDDSTPPVTQCTGDPFAYGQSGSYITSAIPNTDPATGATATLQGRRTMYFDAPGGSAATAQAYQARMAQPLVATTTSWTA